ncbi:MAG: hypothetical protein MI865_03675, partial [Proteobacteria bacterium]|nr:hypothetical protein [Pseudomonadota bacterium]
IRVNVLFWSSHYFEFMALKKFVKVSGITNLSEARYCAGMMVDMLGFNLVEGSERFISTDEFREITEWVAGVSYVGEFGKLAPSEIKHYLSIYQIQFIESANLKDLEEIVSLDLPVILNLEIDQSDLTMLKQWIEETKDQVEYAVLRSSDHQIFEEIENTLTECDTSIKLIKGYDVTPASIENLKGIWHGIQLLGNPEDDPGLNDYGDIMDVLESLETD